jgi:hypothetical protein
MVLVPGLRAERHDHLYRLLISKVFHAIVCMLFSLPVKDLDTSARVIGRHVVEGVLPQMGDLKHSFWAEFIIRVCTKGRSVIETPIRTAPRVGGLNSLRLE